MIVRLILFLSLLLSGCAGRHGFDRNAMRATLQHDADTVGNLDLTSTRGSKATASLPLRVALYFVHKDFPAHRTIQKAEWLSTDTEVLLHRLTPLREEGIVSDIVLLVDSTIHGHDVQKIRQAAARYGADAVMIVNGVAAVDRYNNGYAVLYATLIGAYLAPGTESEALFMIDGSLWEVRAERLYAIEAVEGLSTSVGPAMSVEDTHVLAQAKQAALDELGKRMAGQLRRLKDAGRANDRSR